MLSTLRHGNFNSSEIVALTKMNRKGDNFGEAAITFINQCNMERKLGRSLDGELDSKPTNYGKFTEPLLFSMLQEDYDYNSSETLVHPDFDMWVGTPDAFKKCTPKTVVDAKCPYTVESFCKLVGPLYEGLEGMDAMNALMNGYTAKNGLEQPPHKEGKKYYWQLVSNACISGATHAELIVYCPYESEIEVIQKVAVESGNPSVYFIASGSKESLPYIKDDGFYQNINIISFEIPQEDKNLLTQTVDKASKYLITV